jgi:hypothetical protein
MAQALGLPGFGSEPAPDAPQPVSLRSIHRP